MKWVLSCGKNAPHFEVFCDMRTTFTIRPHSAALDVSVSTTFLLMKRVKNRLTQVSLEK